MEENKKNIENYDKKINKSNSKILMVILIVFISIICTFAICFTIYKLYLSNSDSKESIYKDVTVTDTGIADAVAKVYDSVVVVESYLNNKLYATGTGFVFRTDDNNGYILTNSHVIDKATSIKVIFTNNNSVTVNLVGSDSYSDIAVLSVPKSEILSVCEIGSSVDLRVGDTSFAVGAPIDSSTYSWTVTRGIISGKDRRVEISSTNNSAGYVMDVLQTDTAINSGNSGGPLCNSNGEVIGITNMKLSSSNVEGMGFAIPIETAISYANKFLDGEDIKRPYLGISVYDMNANNYNNQSGIYIISVENNSPAAIAGLLKGDIIKKVNDVEVSDSSYFKYELYKYNVGDTIKILVSRNSEDVEISAILGSN